MYVFPAVSTTEANATSKPLPPTFLAYVLDRSDALAFETKPKPIIIPNNIENMENLFC